MTKLMEVYKCNVCGNIVEVLHTGVGTLVCCGQPMQLMTEKTKDEGKEKHVPVLEKTKKGVLIKIGSVPHPMEKKHYIEWVEVIMEKGRYTHFFKPGDRPEILTDPKAKGARIYCNIHGLWKK